MKKTKKKKKSKVELEKVYLELDGSVNIVEVKNGKKTSTPLDGRLVLKVLMSVIKNAVKKELRSE